MSKSSEARYACLPYCYNFEIETPRLVQFNPRTGHAYLEHSKPGTLIGDNPIFLIGSAQ
jgi:hypothetical protein